MASATGEPECCDNCGETIFNDSKVNEIISTWHLNFNLNEPLRIPLSNALSVIFEKNLFGKGEQYSTPPKFQNLKFCTECGETLTLLYNSFKEFIQLCNLNSPVGYLLKLIDDIRKTIGGGFGSKRSSVTHYTRRHKKKSKKNISPPDPAQTEVNEREMLEIKMEAEDSIHFNDSYFYNHNDDGHDDCDIPDPGNNIITPDTNSRVTRYHNRNRSKIQTHTSKGTRPQSSRSSNEDSESVVESEMESESDSSSSVNAGVKGKKKYVRRVQTQRSVECPVCEKTFKSQYLWKIHIINFHKEECSVQIAEFDIEYCAICDHIFRTNRNLRTHQEKIHHVRIDKPVRIVHFPPLTDQDHPCIADGCGKTYTTKAMMYEHVKKYHKDLEAQLNVTPKEKKEPFRRDRKVPCDICGKVVLKIRMKGHLVVHTGEKPYKCSHCNKSFATNSNKIKHMRTVHNIGLDPESFPCSFCGKIFKLREGRRQHEQVVHGQSGNHFVCELCGKSYKTKGGLQLHMEVHEGSSKSPCHICGKHLKRGPSMRRHLKSMHGQGEGSERQRHKETEEEEDSMSSEEQGPVATAINTLEMGYLHY